MSRKQIYSYVQKDVANSDGVNDAWNVTTISVARTGTNVTHTNPFLVANEWICSNIASALRLPVPPSALLRKDKEDTLFASLHFGGDSTPDDVNIQECLKSDLRTCSGILLFDILIANFDRHDGNIKVDKSIAPSEILIYDHDRALFGCLPGGDEKKRLTRLMDHLGITADSELGANDHIFLKTIDSAEHFPDWRSRIESLSCHLIRDLCHEAIGLGILTEHAELAEKFLIHRKDNLTDIINKNRAHFLSIEPASWGLFA